MSTVNYPWADAVKGADLMNLTGWAPLRRPPPDAPRSTAHGPPPTSNRQPPIANQTAPHAPAAPRPNHPALCRRRPAAPKNPAQPHPPTPHPTRHPQPPTTPPTTRPQPPTTPTTHPRDLLTRCRQLTSGPVGSNQAIFPIRFRPPPSRGFLGGGGRTGRLARTSLSALRVTEVTRIRGIVDTRPHWVESVIVN